MSKVKSLCFVLIFCIIIFLVYTHETTNQIEQFYRQTASTQKSITIATVAEDPTICLAFDPIMSNWKPNVSNWTRVDSSTPFANTDQILNATRGYDMITFNNSFPYSVYILDQTDPAYETALEDGSATPDWSVYTTYNKCASTSGNYKVGTLSFELGKPLKLDSFTLPFYDYRTNWLVDNLTFVPAEGPADLQYWMGKYKTNPDVDILCFSGPTGPVYVGSLRDDGVYVEAGTPSNYNTYLRVIEGEYVPLTLPSYSDGKWALLQNRQVLPFYNRQTFNAFEVFGRKVATYEEWFGWAHGSKYDLLNFPTTVFDEPFKVASVVWAAKLSEINITNSNVSGYGRSKATSLPSLENSHYYGPFANGAVRVNDSGELECASTDENTCATSFPSINIPSEINPSNLIKESAEAVTATDPKIANRLTKMSKEVMIKGKSIGLYKSLGSEQKPRESFGFDNVYDRGGRPVDVNRILINSPSIKGKVCQKTCTSQIEEGTGKKMEACEYTEPVCLASMEKMKYLLQTNQYATKMGLYVFIRDLSAWNFTPIMSQLNNSLCLNPSTDTPNAGTLEVCDPSMLWSGDNTGRLFLSESTQALVSPPGDISTVMRPAISSTLRAEAHSGASTLRAEAHSGASTNQRWLLDETGRLHSFANIEQCLTNSKNYDLNYTLGFSDQDYRKDTVRNKLQVAACEEEKTQEQRWVGGIKLPKEVPIQDDSGDWIFMSTTDQMPDPFERVDPMGKHYYTLTEMENCPGQNGEAGFCENPDNGKASPNYYATRDEWQAWCRRAGYDILVFKYPYYGNSTIANKVYVGNLDNINQPTEPPLNAFAEVVTTAVKTWNAIKDGWDSVFGNTRPEEAQKFDMFVFTRKAPAYQATIRTAFAPNRCLANINGTIAFDNCDSFKPEQQWTYQNRQFVNAKDPNVKTDPLLIDAQNGLHLQRSLPNCFTYLPPSQKKIACENGQPIELCYGIQDIPDQLGYGRCDINGIILKKELDADKNPSQEYIDVGKSQQVIFKNTPASWNTLPSQFYQSNIQQQIDQQQQVISQIQAKIQDMTNKRQQTMTDFQNLDMNAYGTDFSKYAETSYHLRDVIADYENRISNAQGELAVEQQKLQNLNTRKAQLAKIPELANVLKNNLSDPHRGDVCIGIKALGVPIPDRYIKISEDFWCDEVPQLSPVDACISMKNGYGLSYSPIKPFEDDLLEPARSIWMDLQCSERDILTEQEKIDKANWEASLRTLQFNMSQGGL